jgi:hypothetical protein
MDVTVMARALRLYNELIRGSVAVHRGYEVKTDGEAFIIAFRDPMVAVIWAAEVQLKLLDLDWPEALYSHPDASIQKGPDEKILFRGLRATMGIHTGNPLTEEDPVTGRTSRLFSIFLKIFLVIKFSFFLLLPRLLWADGEPVCFDWKIRGRWTAGNIWLDLDCHRE